MNSANLNHGAGRFATGLLSGEKKSQNALFRKIGFLNDRFCLHSPIPTFQTQLDLIDQLSFQPPLV